MSATIKVKSGVYQGEYDGLQHLLAVQGERMATCSHEHVKDQAGVCGTGLEMVAWSRQRCLDCQAAVNPTSVWTPDYKAAKRAEANFWQKYEPSECPSEYVVRMTCKHGSFVVWSFSSVSAPHVQLKAWLDGERYYHTFIGWMERPSMRDRWQKRFPDCTFELIGVRKKE